MAEETLLIRIGAPLEEHRDGYKVPFYCESKGIRDYPNYMINVPEWFVEKYPQGDQAFVNIEKLWNAKTNEPYKSTWVLNSEAELNNIGITLPTKDWIEEAAYLINIGADAILNGRETEEPDEEELRDDG